MLSQEQSVTGIARQRRDSSRQFLLPLVMALFTAFLMSGCAHSPPEEPLDPLEPLNRAIWDVNTKVDGWVLRPVAKGYVKYTPYPVRVGVTNFLDNLFYFFIR